MRATFHFRINSFIKGHHLLIALLLFFQVPRGTASKPFSLDSLSTQKVWLASQLIPGSGQVVNKQYWKVPTFYAGMGSMIYMGVNAHRDYQRVLNQYHKPFYGPEERERFERTWTRYRYERNFYYAGAAAFYLASIADALIVNAGDKHSPATATILSTLVPGIGQVYNKKLWKVPVIYGTLASIYYIVDFNQRGYKRFLTAYEQLADPNQVDEFQGMRTREELIYFRDAYRRNRDMAIISLAALYVLNIIDANVDAHFFDWDISDNLALGIEPVLDRGFSAYSANSGAVFGVRFKFDF